MDHISARSCKIAGIIGVTNGMAVQTNIPALKNQATKKRRFGRRERGRCREPQALPLGQAVSFFTVDERDAHHSSATAAPEMAA